MNIDTKLVHAGEPRPRLSGAVAFPIFQSSTFEGKGGAGYHAVQYPRMSNTPLDVTSALSAFSSAASFAYSAS